MIDLPPAPTIRSALRAAAIDLYYHSIRLVPVNVALVLGGLVAGVAWAEAGPAIALPLATLLAVPLAGLARLGALAARGDDVNLANVLDPVRERPRAVLAAGAALLLAATVLGTNLVTGLLAATPLGMALATLAFWGLAVTLAWGFAFWPLLVDPSRGGRPSGEAARIAALLVVAHPVRFGALALILSALLLGSFVLFAAFLTIGIAFVLSVACRYVLPAADRLEHRMDHRPDPAAAAPTTREAHPSSTVDA